MKRLEALIMLAAVAVGLAIVLSSGRLKHSEPRPETKPALTNAEAIQASVEPAEYTGRLIKVTGRVARDPEYDADGTHLQLYILAGMKEADLIVDYPANMELIEGDHVTMSGRVTGSFSGYTNDGNKFKTVRIEARKIILASAEEALAPPRVVWKNKSKKVEHNVEITVDRVEFADAETRFYMNIINLSGQAAVTQVYNSFVTQNKRLAELQPNDMASYPEVPVDIGPSSHAGGVLVFPALSPNDPLVLNLGVSGSDWESDFTFELHPTLK